jgi:hypothetical protein
MHDPSEVEGGYTMGETPGNDVEYLDPMPLDRGPDPCVDFGNYDAAMASIMFNPRDGPWSLDRSNYVGQQQYGQSFWQQPDFALGPDGENLQAVICQDEGTQRAPSCQYGCV